MAGRPAHFETVEQLQELSDAYFSECSENMKAPTITGLALYLGFESRQSIYDYEKKDDEFSYTIKRNRLKVENSYEEHLLTREATGAIFALKNFGWNDKQEVQNTNLNYNVSVSKDEAKEISKALEDEF